jgi:hypothetical protein
MAKIEISTTEPEKVLPVLRDAIDPAIASATSQPFVLRRSFASR